MRYTLLKVLGQEFPVETFREVSLRRIIQFRTSANSEDELWVPVSRWEKIKVRLGKTLPSLSILIRDQSTPQGQGQRQGGEMEKS